MAVSAWGQSIAPGTEPLARARELVVDERWQELVYLLQPVSARSAELEYLYGTALAHLGRWDEARQAFLAAHHSQPRDKRFLIELAGVDFMQKRYPQAAFWLRRGLRFDPSDAYANELLATVYFLQGNVEAAIKYWNRGGKPELDAIRLDPPPRVEPALLDRAFAFSPAGILRLPDLLASEVRVREMGIFPASTFELTARPDGKFDLVFRSQERNGFGSGKAQALISMFRGVFYQTVYPEFFNFNRSAVNFEALVRWDAEKRRAFATLSGPLKANPKWRYRVALDLRNENWDIRDSSSGLDPLLSSLNLRREAVSAEFSCFSSGRWQWSTGAEFSRRDYRDVLGAAGSAAELLLRGYELKHTAQLKYELLRIPERRFAVSTGLSSQIATIWSQPRHGFSKLQASAETHWLPQPAGDDYETKLQLRAGTIMGVAPLDELFVLGMERDNDLWLRAHAGTHDGRKGNGPLGRNYLVGNWELDKNIYRNSLLTFKLGPFLDTGKITDSSPLLGSKQWLADTGVQVKVGALGVRAVFSYGKDLRTGRNVFYATAGR